jgi:hypothetical protein
VVSDQPKLTATGPPALTNRAWKSPSVPDAVKLTRAAAGLAPGSVLDVSVTTTEDVTAAQASSPENTVSTPGGVLSPVVFLTSSE